MAKYKVTHNGKSQVFENEFDADNEIDHYRRPAGNQIIFSGEYLGVTIIIFDTPNELRKEMFMVEVI